MADSGLSSDGVSMAALAETAPSGVRIGFSRNERLVNWTRASGIAAQSVIGTVSIQYPGDQRVLFRASVKLEGDSHSG